jgi:hypothetical protein
MSWSEDRSFRFTIKLALRRAFRLVRGLRKQVTDVETERMADSIAEDVKRSNWQVKLGPPAAGGGGPYPFPPTSE